jgi:hypothetical protein
VVNRYVGSGGLAYWIDPGLELVAEYELTIEDLPVQFTDAAVIEGYREVSHTIFLEANLRFP